MSNLEFMVSQRLMFETILLNGGSYTADNLTHEINKSGSSYSTEQIKSVMNNLKQRGENK